MMWRGQEQPSSQQAQSPNQRSPGGVRFPRCEEGHDDVQRPPVAWSPKHSGQQQEQVAQQSGCPTRASGPYDQLHRYSATDRSNQQHGQQPDQPEQP